jgi:hypothetical protein
MPYMAIVKSFILCDKIIQDQLEGGKFCAIGLFDRIWAPAFPCEHGPFGVILLVTDAVGEYNFVMDLVHIETDQLIASAAFPKFISEDPLNSVNIGLQFPRLGFPSPGRYEFRLSSGRQFIERRDLELKLAPTAGG